MKNNKKRNLLIVLIVCLFIISMRFFDVKIFDNNTFKYIQFFYLLIISYLSFKGLFKYKGGFVFPIRLILYSMFFSIFVNYFTWHQSIFDSIIMLMPLAVWIFFFFLLKQKINPFIIEKIITYFAILYVVLYAFQFIYRENIYFGWQDEIEMSRGIYRIIFPGGGVFFFTAFLALSKISTKTKHKYFWIIFACLGIIVPILQVTRQSIAAVLLIYIYHFIKSFSVYKKLIIFIILILSYNILFNTNNPLVDGLKSDINRDVELKDDYVRIRAANYLLNELSPTLINAVFGNGVPRPKSSKYGDLIQSKEKIEGIYIVDVGLIGFYALFGVFAVIAYVIIWLKTITIDLPTRFYYLKYYLWFLLLTSLTSDYTFEHNFLVVNVCTIYIYQYMFYLKNIPMKGNTIILEE